MCINILSSNARNSLRLLLGPVQCTGPHISESGQAVIAPFPLHRIVVYITASHPPLKEMEREPSSFHIPMPRDGTLRFRANEMKT